MTISLMFIIEIRTYLLFHIPILSKCMCAHPWNNSASTIWPRPNGTDWNIHSAGNKYIIEFKSGRTNGKCGFQSNLFGSPQINYGAIRKNKIKISDGEIPTAVMLEGGGRVNDNAIKKQGPFLRLPLSIINWMLMLMLRWKSGRPECAAPHTTLRSYEENKNYEPIRKINNTNENLFILYEHWGHSFFIEL